MAKILLVEDDEFLRDIYNESLISAGYDVTTAVDGEDGLNKIKQAGWDLILLDVLMPKLSGIDIVKQIKSSSTFPPTQHIVFLTNIDNEDTIHQLQELGDGYLVKSQLTPEEFVEKVKSYLPAN